MGLHHSDGPICPLCESKLREVHPYMRGWYRRKKAKYSSLHVSWGFRDPVSQQRAFEEHKSNVQWPNSPHNHVEDGRPMSLALDIFQIDDDFTPRFSPEFCKLLDRENQEDHEPVVNGGYFKLANGKPLGDYCHFQYVPKAVTPPAVT
jgi:hypothetical protein